jgi:hypothetical protein
MDGPVTNEAGLTKQEQIELNVRRCNAILEVLDDMNDSDFKEHNIWLHILELENKVEHLKQLYEQIIT